MKYSHIRAETREITDEISGLLMALWPSTQHRNQRRDIERFRTFVLHFLVTVRQRRQVTVPHCSPSASLCSKKAQGLTLTSGGRIPFLFPALDLSVSKSPWGNQPACILKSVTNPRYWQNTLHKVISSSLLV